MTREQFEARIKMIFGDHVKVSDWTVGGSFAPSPTGRPASGFDGYELHIVIEDIKHYKVHTINKTVAASRSINNRGIDYWRTQIFLEIFDDFCNFMNNPNN